MGELPARISAEEFVTPPELDGWKLSSSSAGRIGGIRFELRAERGRTRLGRCYQQIPMRVNVLQVGGKEREADGEVPVLGAEASNHPPALVYLVNPTAGLMDGDGQLIHIEAGPNTRAVVAGQSATRIHPSVNGFCTQQWRVTVHSGAILVILPGPAIPFQGCRYYQRAEIILHPGAQFFWGDVWTAGRYARADASELFRFESIVQDLAIRRGDQLVYRDRFCWKGPWNIEMAQRQFGTHPAFGSLFATGEPEQAERNAAGQEEIGDAHRSPFLPASLSPCLFSTAAEDRCWRWLGSVEDVIHSMAHTALSLAASRVGSQSPWLLAGNHLGPNHWFNPPRTSGVLA